MSKHWSAVAVAVAMVITGLVQMRSPDMRASEIFRVQQWTLLIAGAITLLFALIAAKRPRNAGFSVILASMAVAMSAAMALPFEEPTSGLPSIVLGLAGMAAGIYCMTGTRAGDR